MALPFEFVHLPDLVYERIMKDMDINSLKALRLCCKTTRSWVETEDILKRFNIHIYSTKFLHKELFKSDTKWSSFSFSVENPFSQNISASADFLLKYGSDIKALFFATSKLIARDDYFQPVSAITIIESCPNLRCLSLEELDILNCSNDTLKKLITNWERLEILEIREFKYLKCSSKQSGFFKNIFENCPHLKKLQLPRTMYGEGETDEHHDRYVIEPTINYLEQSAKFLERLNIHRNDSRDDDKPSLRKLIRICLEKNVTVLGTSSTMQKMIANFEEEDPCVSKVIGTLNFINDTMLLMKFTNLEELRLEWSKICVLNDNYEVPEFPSLRSVNLIFVQSPWEANPKSYEVFVKNIMKKRRDSVTRFSARVLIFRECYPDPHIDLLILKAHDFTSNFPNLQELSLEGWMAEDDEFLVLWKGLSNLESLFLQRCVNLTDRGFLGDDKKNPAILQLKRLAKLYLDDIPKLTDKFYKVAISRMKLKYFFAISTVSRSKFLLLPTKKSGFLALKQGPFAKSIQYFTRPTVDFDEGVHWKLNRNEFRDISTENYGFNKRSSCRKYFKNFKNLREPNIKTWEFKRPVAPYCCIS